MLHVKKKLFACCLMHLDLQCLIRIYVVIFLICSLCFHNCKGELTIVWMGRSTDEELETKEMDVRSLSSSHRQAQSVPYMHKVGVPPKQNLFKEFTSTVKETFFADDPLRPFKDQTRSRKFVLGMQAIFPILEWGRNYNLTKFRGDLISGLTIASLCIPQVDLIYCC